MAYFSSLKELQKHPAISLLHTTCDFQSTVLCIQALWKCATLCM